VLGAVLGLALFAVLSGGSFVWYIAATIGGVALGLIIAVAILNFFGDINVLVEGIQELFDHD